MLKGPRGFSGRFYGLGNLGLCLALVFVSCQQLLDLKRELGYIGVRYMGGCQKYGPSLGTLNIRGRIIIGIQKGAIILTTTHIYIYMFTQWDNGK